MAAWPVEGTVPHSEDFEVAVARLRPLLLIEIEETSGLALHIKAATRSPELKRRCRNCWARWQLAISRYEGREAPQGRRRGSTKGGGMSSRIERGR